mmetsp:Transcript_76749/g.217076  ORF Transcript_76749/g.217076 Transcript_76749/m.217076 type:complete len:352 (+) Transcript_76749:159-1214(+)
MSFPIISSAAFATSLSPFGGFFRMSSTIFPSFDCMQAPHDTLPAVIRSLISSISLFDWAASPFLKTSPSFSLLPKRAASPACSSLCFIIRLTLASSFLAAAFCGSSSRAAPANSRAAWNWPSSACANAAAAFASGLRGSSWHAFCATLLAWSSESFFTGGAALGVGKKSFSWRISDLARPMSTRTRSASTAVLSQPSWPSSSHCAARRNRRAARAELAATSFDWSLMMSLIQSAFILSRASRREQPVAAVWRKSSAIMRSSNTFLMPAHLGSHGPLHGSSQPSSSTSAVSGPAGLPSGRAPSASFRTAEPPAPSRRATNSMHSGTSPSPTTKRFGAASWFTIVLNSQSATM